MYDRVIFTSVRFDLFRPSKPGDVGHDLFADVSRHCQSWLDRFVSWWMNVPVMVIFPFTKRAIPSGIRVRMPDTLWCEVRPRSSTARKLLHVIGGTIDSGYTGELFAVIHNFGLIPRLVVWGDRYAQVVFHPAIRPDLEEVLPFDFNFLWANTDRGATGFGSTGQ